MPMETVLEEDKEKRITKKEEVVFTTKVSGIYLIEISAKAKNRKQLGGSDDEDLRVEINDQKFPFNSLAAFSGSSLKGLRKTVYFLLPLDSGKNVISLIPDISATITKLSVHKINTDLEELDLAINNQAEDGDRRSWITITLVDVSLSSFTVTIKLTRRFLDSDDVKIIIDGQVKRNIRSILHKYWYFIASLFSGETQTETFITNFSSGTHYIEFWADRMPTFKSIIFSNLTPSLEEETIQDKIHRLAKEYGLDPELMIKVAKKESQFDPKATSPVGAKGIFQLMDITVKQIAKLGYEITDPYDPDQNITGGIIYFKWLYNMYQGDEQQLEKTLAAWNWGQNNFPKDGPLDYSVMPRETRNFIEDILNK